MTHRRDLAPALPAGRPSHSDFWTLLPSMMLGGVGMAMTMSPMTAAAMGSVPVDKAGVGSGVLNSFRQMGGSLGIALMGAIVASYLHGVAALAGRAAQEFVNGLHAALLGERRDHVRRGDRRRRHSCGRRPAGRARAHRGGWRREHGDAPAGGRAPAARSSRPRSASSRTAATTARRRPRSPAPPACRSRSSTGTSRRSATSISPRSTTCGARRARAGSGRSPRRPTSAARSRRWPAPTSPSGRLQVPARRAVGAGAE